MKQLTYKTTIDASAQNVWRTITDANLYKQWAKNFSADSQFEGDWSQGSTMTFFDPNMGGTRAVLEKVTENEYIMARHFAIVNKDKVEDTTSDMGKKWVGITEEYTLKSVEGGTELQIIINTHEDFEAMFNDMWAPGLAALKTVAENV